MQEIHLVGINHKTSKVSDRERFIVDDSNLVYLNDFLISKLDKKISGFFNTKEKIFLFRKNFKWFYRGMFES